MTLPDKTHPIWKIAQSGLMLVGLIYWVEMEKNGVATHEAIGMGSGVLLGKLAHQIFGKDN